MAYSLICFSPLGEEKRSGVAGGKGITEFERKLPGHVEPNLQYSRECYNKFSTS